MYAIAAYGVQCLAAGCGGQVEGSRVCVQEEGCCTNRDAYPAALYLTTDNQQPSTAHHRRQ